MSPSLTPAAGPRPSAPGLYLRQIGAVLRLELRKNFFSKRGWWVYLLALGPLAITTLHWLPASAPPPPPAPHERGEPPLFSPRLSLFYSLRLGIFFGSVGIFSNLFRGEMLEKTLHYYYLTPVRRELLVAGKYLAGLSTALILWCGSTALAFLTVGRHFGAAYNDYIFHGPGLNQLGSYILVAALACAGYGAVFLMSGLLFKNPMIPAAVVMVWENLNPFLPTLLKKISVIFYLKNLCPVEIPIPPPFNVMVIEADPTPFWIAVPGLLMIALILLAYAGLSARQTEISYSD